jgi:hypothetical protein
MKETIEEVAERLGDMFDYEPEFKSGVIYGVIEGAKWHAKTMYSYDEVRAIAYKAYCIGQLDEPTEGKFNQWINQFKKK